MSRVFCVAPLRKTMACVMVALSLATSGFGAPTFIESEGAQTPVNSTTMKQLRSDRPPQPASSAWALMDATTGQIILSKNPHDHRAPASTTKIMTALVTLEKARLDEVVTAGPNVMVEPTIIGLDPGDQLTVEQLLYGMLLPSGNDAAIALAEHVGGSVPRFAEMMNAKAAQLGLKDSHFVNANGLDAQGHYSSANDLAVITRAALANPVFAKIASTREYRIDGPVRWLFKNSNRLLESFPGADGVKTGYTDDAGRCLVASATQNGHRAIAVVLDSADTYGETGALLNYLLANYDWETLQIAGLPLTEYGQGADARQAIGRSSPTIVFPAWQRPYLRRFFSFSGSPSRGEGPPGLASYYLLGRKVAEIELFDGS